MLILSWEIIWFIIVVEELSTNILESNRFIIPFYKKCNAKLKVQ
jgi:hypothetical protein